MQKLILCEPALIPLVEPLVSITFKFFDESVLKKLYECILRGCFHRTLFCIPLLILSIVFVCKRELDGRVCYRYAYIFYSVSHMTWHSKNVAHKFVQLFKKRASRPVLFLIILPCVLNLKTQKHILCETALIVQESHCTL